MAAFRTPYDEHYDQALELWTRGGTVDQVLQHVAGIDDENFRDGTLAKMAGYFAAQGRVAEAERFCDAIQNPIEHADALFEVGRELSSHNDPTSAKRIFDQTVTATSAIKSGAWEAPAIFLQVSDALWVLGETQEAMQLLKRAAVLAQRPPQHFESSKTLAGCARLLSKWGHPALAIEVASTIESAEQRDTVTKELRKAPE